MDAITFYGNAKNLCAIVPTLVVIFISFLITNRERNTYEIPLKTDVLLFQTYYRVVAQILVEVGNYLLK